MDAQLSLYKLKTSLTGIIGLMSTCASIREFDPRCFGFDGSPKFTHYREFTGERFKHISLEPMAIQLTDWKPMREQLGVPWWYEPLPPHYGTFTDFTSTPFHLIGGPPIGNLSGNLSAPGA